MNGESSLSPSLSGFDASLAETSAGSGRRRLRDALFWTPILSALFIVVYGSTMWITAIRTDIGTCYFPIERWIPFVPVMIIPYWSLDLFFAGAAFVCTTRGELNTLVKRIFFVILTAGACFLLFPLQLGFKRPEVTGFLGYFFSALRSFDLPYNLAPSLHIALRSILWPVYTRHTKGALNLAVKIWFVLIGVSTLLVWQHHLVDLLSGQMLAMLCLYLIPGWEVTADQREREAAMRPPRKIRIAVSYALGALLCAFGANMILPWGLLLVWPAFGLGMMAAAYAQVGAAAFRKFKGKLPLSAKLVLAPYLIGNRICFEYYKRQGAARDELVPGVSMGRLLSGREAEEAVREGVGAVLDLSAEYSENDAFLSLPYHNIQILDLTWPSVSQLAQAVDFIEQQLPKRQVYVHCGLGYSRVTAVAAAFLISSGKASSPQEAVEKVRNARPRIVVDEELINILGEYQRDYGQRRTKPESS